MRSSLRGLGLALLLSIAPLVILYFLLVPVNSRGEQREIEATRSQVCPRALPADTIRSSQ